MPPRVFAWGAMVVALALAGAATQPGNDALMFDPEMAQADAAAGGSAESDAPIRVASVLEMKPDASSGAEESRSDGATDGAGLIALAQMKPRAAEIVRVDDRWYRPARTIRMRVTAYSPDARSCGKFADGITASGKPVTFNGGRLVAADTRLFPFGTLVSVPGYNSGLPVPVLDRGGAIKGHRLDVLYSTHERAMLWGVQYLDVIIWEDAGRNPARSNG